MRGAVRRRNSEHGPLSARGRSVLDLPGHGGRVSFGARPPRNVVAPFARLFAPHAVVAGLTTRLPPPLLNTRCAKPPSGCTCALRLCPKSRWPRATRGRLRPRRWDLRPAPSSRRSCGSASAFLPPQPTRNCAGDQYFATTGAVVAREGSTLLGDLDDGAGGRIAPVACAHHQAAGVVARSELDERSVPNLVLQAEERGHADGLGSSPTCSRATSSTLLSPRGGSW
jgi:hypothetical protein